jgi:NCAIR mutase (PurE)-related protein
MDKQDIQRLLEDVRAGKLSVARGVERLRHMPFEDLGFAKIDHHAACAKVLPRWFMRKGKLHSKSSASFAGCCARDRRITF